ncbi:hypothetical protein GPA10_04435 [Streptomyces sp. p1417]|uniref:Uncharacterized protein n=1 Tax=Streptomyces typhae TaxID=2681492 RepID=A0A6L6WS86_9ACTN|nr:hypothetical protein [Streptomyces typhae]MVO84034.1 hypothetical protein [Streptomyces typhae]
MSTDASDRRSASNTPGRFDGPSEHLELAEKRECLADERERAADAREDAADERERCADAREAAADERERALDEREIRSDQQARQAGEMVAGRRQRSYEAIGRARALLAASQDRLNRTEEALARVKAREVREQHLVKQSIAATSPQDFSDTPSGQVTAALTRCESLEVLVDRLHARFLAAAAALADAHELLADHYERLSSDETPEAEDQRDLAACARRQAGRVRQVANELQ